MSIKPHILLVDNNQKTVLIADFLRDYGFDVTVESVLDLHSNHINELDVQMIILVIADNEVTVCADIRRQFDLPILLMANDLSDIDQVLALEMGADDYINCSTLPRLLLAKIRAILRRSNSVNPAPIQDNKSHYNLLDDCSTFDDLMIDKRRRSLYVQGEEVVLTTPEFDIVTLLAANAGSILSRDSIYQMVRGSDYEGSRYIDLVISRIRKKIFNVNKSEYIKTVRGQGYLFLPSISSEQLAV